MFKNLTQLAQMMKNLGSLQDRVKEHAQRLKRTRIDQASPCRRVAVVMNGVGQVESIQFHDQVVLEDRDAVALAVVQALNAAIDQARSLHMDTVKDLTGGMEVPGMDTWMEELKKGTVG
jgi:DNA-binding protein YbaB